MRTDSNPSRSFASYKIVFCGLYFLLPLVIQEILFRVQQDPNIFSRPSSNYLFLLQINRVQTFPLFRSWLLSLAALVTRCPFPTWTAWKEGEREKADAVIKSP